MKTEDTFLFRIRLKQVMDSLGLNKTRFAKQIGICPSALSQILNGTRLPSMVTLYKICRQTGASSDYLLGIKEDVK